MFFAYQFQTCSLAKALYYSPHSVLFRNILACPSSKENKTKTTKTTPKVTGYTHCVFVGKKKRADAVRKLDRQLKGNSRSVSEKSGERQETIFSTLH